MSAFSLPGSSPLSVKLFARRYAFLAAIAIGALVCGLGLASTWDRKLLEPGFAALRRFAPQAATGDVVVVGVDEQTMDLLPEPLALWHRHLGAFLEAAADAGARLVALDLILPDRAYDQIMPGLDRALVDGILRMRQAGGVILARTVDEGGRPRRVHAPFLSAAGADATGYALWRVDPDRVVRWFDERLGEAGEAVPTLAGQVSRRLGVEPRHGLINYALGERFPYLPLHQILAWRAEGARRQLLDALGGKVVLVGSVLPFVDRIRSPIPLQQGDPPRETEAGVFVHAQTVRSALSGRMVQPLPGGAAALLGGIAGLAWLGGRRVRTALAVSLHLTGIALVAGLVALRNDWHLPVAGIIASGVLACLARLGWETISSLRERRRLRTAFSGYVSPQVMSEIDAGRLTGLASARRFICVLVMDLRGFTARSERETPERLLDLLNALCEAATEAIHVRAGTVDKFIGDGVLAFFGAPAQTDEPCEAAFAAARDILERVQRMSDTLVEQGNAGVAIGIGLACGVATVGHVGAASRHAYTAIGDCVNVASRLEALSKDLGYPLILSAEVASRLREREQLAYLGVTPLKGHSPLEVFGWRQETDSR